jgi:ATP-dependent Lon protease
MQESARTALSYVRSHAGDFGIDPKFWNNTEIHVHVPAGAIPKDGPSAGVTMTTAMTSLLSDRPVKPALAMTGEVTLTGKVLPVGGIKEKVLAAKRAGIKTVILPERNRKDLEEDIPAELREGMTFLYAKTVKDVLENALEPAPAPKKIRVTDKSNSAAKVPANQAKVNLDAPLPESVPQPTAPPASARES